MAGITDGDFARLAAEGGAGGVSIGGFSIERKLLNASKEINQRGRAEFIFPWDRASEFIAREVNKVKGICPVLVNLRTTKKDQLIEFCRKLSDICQEGFIIEINAHCRQPEIMALGGGQNLLSRTDLLKDMIFEVKALKLPVSMKIRSSVIDNSVLIEIANKCSPDFLHIDSYSPGVPGTDLETIRDVSSKIRDEVKIIGNNSIVDARSSLAVMRAGASYFSVARAVKDDPSKVGKIWSDSIKLQQK